MLDTLVSGGFSSGEEDEGDYVTLLPVTSPTEGSTVSKETMATETTAAAKLSEIADGKQKVRVPSICRTKVERKTFVRYDDPEQHAIQSFEFLDDMSQASSTSQSEDDKSSKSSKNTKKVLETKNIKTDSGLRDNGNSPKQKAKTPIKNLPDSSAVSPTDDTKAKQNNIRPLNPIVKILRAEGKKEPLKKNSNFEGIQLNDSCCEDFTSSGLSDSKA